MSAGVSLVSKLKYKLLHRVEWLMTIMNRFHFSDLASSSDTILWSVVDGVFTIKLKHSIERNAYLHDCWPCEEKKFFRICTFHWVVNALLLITSLPRMCSASMTHTKRHASFTNWRRTKWRKTRTAILLFVWSTKTTTEWFLLKLCQRNGN